MENKNELITTIGTKHNIIKVNCQFTIKDTIIETSMHAITATIIKNSIPRPFSIFLMLLKKILIEIILFSIAY